MSGAVNQTGALPPLGQVIREARLRAGLTEEQLGQRVGYSGASISRFERGKQPLGDVVLLRSFATALGLEPRELGLSDAPLPRR